MTITNPTAKNPNPTLAIALGCQLITLELKSSQAINANIKNPIRKKIVPMIGFTFIITSVGNCSLDINIFREKEMSLIKVQGKGFEPLDLCRTSP